LIGLHQEKATVKWTENGGRKMVKVTARGRGQSGSVPTPEPYEVYLAKNESVEFEWIINGTDSKLYLVPAEPGGWLRRCDYQGQIEKLKAVSQKKARSICWTVYGDVGRVTMEGANLEHR
jgi:hypothetical protein